MTEYVTPPYLLVRYTADVVSRRASQDLNATPMPGAVLTAYLADGTLPGDATDAAVQAIGARVVAAVDGANGLVLPYELRAHGGASGLPFLEGFRDAAAKIAVFNLSNQGRSPDATDKITLDYEAAMEWLKMIAENGASALSSGEADPGWRNVSIRRV